jgi:hypothetical protein
MSLGATGFGFIVGTATMREPAPGWSRAVALASVLPARLGGAPAERQRVGRVVSTA